MVIVMKNNEFDLYEAIAANIKKYRKEANITQAELSERVGVSHEFIRRIESKKGAKTFSVDTLYKISLALNIDIKNLFDFENK